VGIQRAIRQTLSVFSGRDSGGAFTGVIGSDLEHSTCYDFALSKNIHGTRQRPFPESPPALIHN
jgi:hypothetical protein